MRRALVKARRNARRKAVSDLFGNGFFIRKRHQESASRTRCCAVL